MDFMAVGFHSWLGRFVIVTAVLLILQSKSLGSDASYGLDTELSKLLHLDPLGTNDSFPSLRPGLKRILSHDSQHEVDQKMQALQSLQSTTLVTVKLVGFPSIVRSQLEVQFSRYLEVLNKDEYIKVIGDETHHLGLKNKVEMEVVKVSTPLGQNIGMAIEKLIEDSSKFSPIYHQAIPYQVVDDLIQADLEKPLTSYVIYILNLKPQKRIYAYDYKREKETVPSFAKCLGNFWAGKDRYMWIDLAAGPVEYGPAISGEGMLKKGETYLMSALYGGSIAQKAFLSDLASAVWSASQLLLVPALRIPVHYESTIEVHFYHIQSPDMEDDTKNIDWNAIESTFLNEKLLLNGQSLLFKRFNIRLSQCAVCSAVLARSTKTYTSRVLLDKYSLFVNEYFDSKQLHYLLLQIHEELMKLAGLNDHSMNQVVPVYVFDLDLDRVVLLDRNHQAIAFKDMVIAVRTKGVQTVTEFNCNGRPVIAQTRELERPIVGALLQTVWGVTPTHLTWSPQHNSTLVDYSWSVGQTPFGPFSEVLSLSFVQKDAAPRNVLFTMLNNSIWGASEVLKAVKDQGGERKLLNHKEHAQFTQRWNLFLYKLNKATSAISHFDFNAALFYARSLEHDLFAFQSIVYHAATTLEANMVCFKDPPFPWKWVFLVQGIFGFSLYIWIRREKLFVNKRKRF